MVPVAAPGCSKAGSHHFRVCPSLAVDLHAGLDVSTASMRGYSDNIVAAAESLSRPVALCGWSMGGLAALQAATHLRPHSIALIEPSPPGEVQGFDSKVRLTGGVFDPERVYGRFPPGMPSRPESLRARRERKRGVSVPSLLCHRLSFVGRSFARSAAPPSPLSTDLNSSTIRD